MNPAVVVVHGRDAGEHLGLRLRTIPDPPQLLAVDHLSWGWSQERAVALGRELRNLTSRVRPAEGE